MKLIYEDVNRYYTDKVRLFGPTPQGMDWKNEESQLARFEQLLKIVKPSSNRFSLNDLGCGSGKLYEVMKCVFSTFNYVGYDLSEEMIYSAQKIHGSSENHSFHMISDPTQLVSADYTVASGIFNVKMDHHCDKWQEYFLAVLKEMDKASIKGFAFNCLTQYSDKEYMRDNLYYADPLFYFDYCKRNFSRNVALLHDYDLYEFTILVRKG